MRAPFDLAGSHRQQRLRAVERLHLGFLVNTQHNGAFRWRQVESDDVADLLHEQRIRGELEGPDAVRLQPEGAPDAVHGRGRMADLLGHGPQAPMRRAFRTRFQRLADCGRDLIVTDLARRTRTRLVVETIHPALREAIAPCAGRCGTDTHLARNLLVVEPRGRSENDARPLRQRLRRAVLARQSR